MRYVILSQPWNAFPCEVDERNKTQTCEIQAVSTCVTAVLRRCEFLHVDFSFYCSMRKMLTSTSSSQHTKWARNVISAEIVDVHHCTKNSNVNIERPIIALLFLINSRRRYSTLLLIPYHLIYKKND